MIVLNWVLALFLSFTNPLTKATTKTTAEEPPIKVIEVSACDAKVYKDNCVKNLPDGYTFLKSYTIDGKDGSRKKVDYSYIFSKGTRYILLLSNGDPKTSGLKVSIYDSNRKFLTSSYLRNKYYPAVIYECNATGIYFFSFEFENTNRFCAASVLALKR